MPRPVPILLPGLHGTANLFDRFVATAPSNTPLRVQPLPNDVPLKYDALTDWLIARLPPAPIILIAESFSGPLALFAAARTPRVVGIVLCVTFVTPPAPRILSHTPRALFGVTPPVAAISALLSGGDREVAREAQRTVRAIPTDVIASRISSALRVDARSELQRFPGPLLCIAAKRDWIVPARTTAVIRALKPTAEYVEIDGPHMLMQTRVPEVWNVVAPFLNRASAE